MSAAAIVLSPSATPSTYHRIVSPTLQIPSDPQFSIPVGLLACQRDPLLRELLTTVVSCQVSQTHPAPSGRKGKKDTASTASRTLTLEIILHDTTVFPEGGGQPSDTGLIQTADERFCKVLQARRHGGHAVHYVQVEDAEVDILQFTVGTKVLVKLGDADWDRRCDHMTMHTSQHLLSAVLEDRLNIQTLSWSLTEAPAPCYVELSRSMTSDEIQSIQTTANRYVFEGRNVRVEVQEMEKPKEPEKLEDHARGFAKAIPADYTGGIMRVVVIDRIDRNPCCGTHWPSLHNLQLFLVPQTESLARSNTTSARLYFFAGPRLIEYLTNTHKQLTATASTLSCGAPQVPARVEQVIDERKRAEKRIDDLESELAKCIARDVAKEMGQSSDLVFSKHVHRVDDSINPLGFLSAIATAFTGVARAESQYLLILSSTPSAQSVTGTSVSLILGSDEKQVKEAGGLLKGAQCERGRERSQMEWKVDRCLENGTRGCGYLGYPSSHPRS
ncbi:ThrRS/AlaRS common domain-containing protein [Boletus reticuloceps]|uniref:ThrRS/AlaRS common domain-containing protein n=1 Tax=Boletus reticuloceps TaxID=495285 RepID=A0A8I3ADT8_9AGAM|nr:ThrRS/AlaRS common domain-containing protein [Boletus reticuloceps]